MGFDRIAPVYRVLERVLAGGRMQRCRTAFLEGAAAPREALVVGEGPGRFLESAARRWRSTRVTCVDSSAAMLGLARDAWMRAGGDPRNLALVQAELPDWEAAAGRYDLLATHFFLDCFDAPAQRRVVSGLARAATPDAVWLVSEFAVPARGIARWRARAALWLAYRFFRVATRLPARRLVDPEPWLEEAGFTLAERRTSEWGLLRAERWVRAAIRR